MQKISKNIYWPIVIFLLLQNYVSSETFWVVGFIYCAVIVFVKNRGKAVIPFKEYKWLFVFLIWGSVLGIAQYWCGTVYLIDLIRDVFYYTNPIIFIFMGACFAKDKVDIHRVLNSFIVSSAILSAINLVQIVGNRSLLNAIESVYKWRDITGDGTVVMGVALAIILSGVLPIEKRISKIPLLFLGIITGLYFVLTLSRTNILIMIIMYMVLVLNKSNAKKVLMRILSIVVLLIICVIVLNHYLPNGLFGVYIEKLLASLTETSVSHSWSTYAEVQSNWRGYETYSAINQWKQSSTISQLIGAGFGTRIYVGGYAYSLLRQTINGIPAESIAVLHNGYATQLIKLGVLGVILYIVFYLMIIHKARKYLRNKNDLVGRLFLAVGIILLLQTYFLNGLFKDYCFYPMMIVLGFSGYIIERNSTYEDEE